MTSEEPLIPKEVAERVRELRMGRPKHSWRALAGVICVEYPDFVREYYGDPVDLFENQLLGSDICRQAERTLDLELWSID